MALAFFGKSTRVVQGADGRSSATAGAVIKAKRRLRVRPKITYAFAGDGIAISDQPGDLAKLGKTSVADIGLCIEISNEGGADITVAEVGLAGWFDSPRIAEYEPLLHDNRPWPRLLKPGEHVIAHLPSGLKHQSVLKSLKRAYVRTDDDIVSYAAGGPALKYYVKHMRTQAISG